MLKFVKLVREINNRVISCKTDEEKNNLIDEFFDSTRGVTIE